MQSFTDDFRFLAVPTTEDATACVEPGDLSDPERLNADQVAEYLAQHPLNAVVLVGSDCDIFGELIYDQPFLIARTADEKTFYGALHPCCEPDDVAIEGVDVESALRETTIEYYE